MTRTRNGRVIHAFPAKPPEKRNVDGKPMLLFGYNERYHPDTEEYRESCIFCTPPTTHAVRDFIKRSWREE